ncbi:chaplin family protein [Streptomyces sp. NPDC100445]|uniref:chaplin n=1 Tax=Streptomyces sp. NPDC100445 TaxID=3366102 RepID=UPI00380FAF45
MRQSTRKGLMTMAAATGVIAAVSGHAHADAAATGATAGSPGVLSGNTVQVPVHAPVDVCGNTVNVVGLLDPAVGNTCAGHGGAPARHHGDSGGSGGSHAGGGSTGSPGVGSGNTVQVPVDVPVNVCGNSVDVVGAGNPAVGDDCGPGAGHPAQPPGRGHGTPPGEPSRPGHPNHPGHPNRPGHPVRPAHPGDSGHSAHPGGPRSQTRTAARSDRPATTVQLAHTGNGLPLGVALPGAGSALLAGALLYRKARSAA